MESKRYKIIITDDDRTFLTTARHALMNLYDVYTVTSGEKMFALLDRITPDLILLDVDMPEMNGYEAIKILKSNKKTEDVPVIFLSVLIDAENEIEGLELGAVDYIFKPFLRKLLIKHIDLHLTLENQKKELRNYSNNLEELVEKKTQTVFELQNAVMKTVAELVERRDDITGGHIERTQKYLRMLVRYLVEEGVYTDELSTWDINLFVMSSQLHDVGKISIKDSILLKPGKLTYDEFEEMKKHTTAGAEIIRKIEETTTDRGFLTHAEILAESHHERWDGTGYPHGLTGKDIPLQGRLMAIVDVYDALTTKRLYKNTFTHQEAVDIIRDGVGSHFDPLVAETFLKHEKDFERAGD